MQTVKQEAGKFAEQVKNTTFTGNWNTADERTILDGRFAEGIAMLESLDNLMDFIDSHGV